MAAKSDKAAIKPFALSDFFTLGALEAGKKFPLTLPDGTETEHYLMVIGADAPAARRRLLEITRERRDRDDTKLSADALYDIEAANTIKYRSSLVIGWSFDAPFSTEAVAELIQQNPGLSTDIELFASNRARFFAPELKAS